MRLPIAIAMILLALTLDMARYGYLSTPALLAIAAISVPATVFAAVRLSRWYISSALAAVCFAVILIVQLNTPCPYR
ncbi:hypothetical protein [Terriglobus tenax]|uniref:hypothetical protein n=1 Tax=Terriglobus tenax TaxID=1111115 RepID=UPI0021DFF2AA|nr:hypothetical protein [Terriglobus tenax]